jgi:hypothetical protein
MSPSSNRNSTSDRKRFHTGHRRVDAALDTLFWVVLLVLAFLPW